MDRTEVQIGTLLTVGSGRELGGEIGHCLDEVTVLDGHRDINRIEVPFAVKATSQVRFGIHGRSVLLAAGT